MDNPMRYPRFADSSYSPASHGGRGDSFGHFALEDVQEDEQLDMLMSLALDDMLSLDEAKQFDRLLAEKPGFRDSWESWQAFDRAFQSTSRVEPPADFVSKFEGRLLRSERRRRLWIGLVVGAVAGTLWTILIFGLAGASAFVMFNQSGWLTAAVQFLVYWFATVQSQIAMMTSAVKSAVATPQVQGMLLVYTMMTAFTLWFWARFLRRSVDDRSSIVSA